MECLRSWKDEFNIHPLLLLGPLTWDDPPYAGIDIHSKIIECTTLDEDGKIVRKDRFENSFSALEKYISQFHEGDIFVMQSTGFYAKLANPLKISLTAESRMKIDDHMYRAKLLKNDCPVRDVPPSDIVDMRRIVRRSVQLKRDVTRIKNRINFELLRMHTDYDVNLSKWK